MDEEIQNESQSGKLNCFIGNNKTELSIEKLQSMVAEYLQMENLNFLIGAGCSSHVVDEIEKGIPIMSALFREFFEKNQNFELASKKPEPFFAQNLERMLEIMEALQTVQVITEVEPEIEKKIDLVKSFLREKVINGQKSKEVLDIYKGFYSKIAQRTRESPINIFTTNYDMYNEMALDELGFSYNNGFTGTYRRKFNPVSYNFMYVENMNLHRDVWGPVSSFFNLVKLHGSISWIKRDDEVWEHDYADEKILEDGESVMIYPTPLKDRSTLMTPYSDLFRVMENKIIRDNSVLFILGYSFGDDHINRVILNGLANSSFKLLIFGRSQNISKLIDLNDARIMVVNSDDKIQYFDKFVEKVLPPIHPDVYEGILRKPVAELIRKFESGYNNE